MESSAVLLQRSTSYVRTCFMPLPNFHNLLIEWICHPNWESDVDFLGVGVPEILVILVLALIIIGPREMVKVSRTIGEFLRKVMTSDAWRAVQRASQEMRTLPNRLARESGLQDI